MALETNELFSSAAGVGSGLRVEPLTIQVKTFAQGSGTIAKLTPVSFNDALDFWALWTGKGSEITSITANATTATDGDWLLTVEGITTAAILHDASAALIEVAIVNAGICGPEDVAVVDTGGGLGSDDGVATITWSGDLGDKVLTITANFAGLTGNTHVLAEEQAGTAGTGVIRGFMWPDAVTLAAANEVQAQVLLQGKVHRDDIVLPAGSTSGELDAALNAPDNNGVSLRDRGLIIQGLISVR